MTEEPTQWYWDLRTGTAVPADERGPADHLLGPYPSRVAAENWKATNERRNDAWEQADAEWDGPDDRDTGTGTGDR